jgi:two-component system response regulator
MKGKTILIVDDNEDDMDLTVRTLRQNRIANEIVVAHDGIEALDYLFGTGAHAGRDTRLQPQLILLDWNMPKLDGCGTLRQMRADNRTRPIPVIVLTNCNEGIELGECCKQGPTRLLSKPLDFNQLAAVEPDFKLYWLIVNELPDHEDQTRQGQAPTTAPGGVR